MDQNLTYLELSESDSIDESLQTSPAFKFYFLSIICTCFLYGSLILLNNYLKKDSQEIILQITNHPATNSFALQIVDQRRQLIIPDVEITGFQEFTREVKLTDIRDYEGNIKLCYMHEIGEPVDFMLSVGGKVIHVKQNYMKVYNGQCYDWIPLAADL